MNLIKYYLIEELFEILNTIINNISNIDDSYHNLKSYDDFYLLFFSFIINNNNKGKNTTIVSNDNELYDNFNKFFKYLHLHIPNEYLNTEIAKSSKIFYNIPESKRTKENSIIQNLQDEIIRNTDNNNLYISIENYYKILPVEIQIMFLIKSEKFYTKNNSNFKLFNIKLTPEKFLTYKSEIGFENFRTDVYKYRPKYFNKYLFFKKKYLILKKQYK